MTAPLAYGEFAHGPAALDRAQRRAFRGWANAIFYRAAAVAIPVFAVLVATELTVASAGKGAVAATIWFLALQKASSRPQLSPLVVTKGAITALAAVAGLAATSLVAFWIPDLGLTEAQLVLMAAGVFLASTVESTRANGTRRRRTVLVGGDGATEELLAEFAKHPKLQFEVVGVVNDKQDRPVRGSRWLGRTRELGAVVRDEQPDLVVLGPDAPREEALSHVLDAALLDVEVVDSHHFHEHAFGRVPVHHVSPAWFMALVHLYRRPYPRLVKRTFDVAAAASALLIAAPLLGIVSLAIYASKSGPVFFRQLRLGEAGSTFEILKFRTMVTEAEKDGVAVWAKEDDPRITRVGRVLRRTRLDELPQLWNVLRGEMSIVGPRPERPEFLKLLEETVPFWTRRNLVKPGITGWAQIRRGYASDVTGTAEKLSYDLYYLKHRTFLFDLAIVSRTVAIVLTGFGSR
jgi:exopolysaccharide biosynthesis polyprenyl glycosylphosphotransferase